MANSIKITRKLEYYYETELDQPRPFKAWSISTTSDIVLTTTQIVGTTHELVAAGDATDDCLMIVENRHATATVQIGGDSGGSFVPWIDIPAGYPEAVLPVVSTLASTYLKSSAANTNVRVTLIKIVAPA